MATCEILCELYYELDTHLKRRDNRMGESAARTTQKMWEQLTYEAKLKCLEFSILGRGGEDDKEEI